jgi:hypothetical protein
LRPLRCTVEPGRLLPAAAEEAPDSCRDRGGAASCRGRGADGRGAAGETSEADKEATNLVCRITLICISDALDLISDCIDLIELGSGTCISICVIREVAVIPLARLWSIKNLEEICILGWRFQNGRVNVFLLSEPAKELT